MMASDLPQFVRDQLASPPKHGDGVHNWMYRICRHLHAHRSKEDIFELLRDVLSNCGRQVPEREIWAAINDSAKTAWRPKHERNGDWQEPIRKRPEFDQKRFDAVLEATPFALSDWLERSPIRYDNEQKVAAEITSQLFSSDQLVCVGWQKNEAITDQLGAFNGELDSMQFIVPNPMSKPFGKTLNGKDSARCLDNTGAQERLVIELDKGTLDQQASILEHLLGRCHLLERLILIVFSGRKSLHAWLQVRGLTRIQLQVFVDYAATLGADPQMLCKCQFARMPGGRRDNGKTQEVYYWNPAALLAKNKPDFGALKSEPEPKSKSNSQAATQEQQGEPPWEQSLLDGGCTSLALSNMKITPREPIFDDWCLVGDLGFIFAARGLGKTWLSMHLAHGAATLTDVGPWKTKKQLKVLYLDGEMPPQDIQARDHVLGEPTQNLIYVNHQILFDRTGKIMNLANNKLQDGILSYCQTNSIGLLCLDNLSTLTSGVDENKSIDWEIIQPWLLRVRRSLITIFFIHHAGRNNQMRGSSKREDPASWVLRLEDPRDVDERAGAHFISRFTKWRSKKQPKTYEWKYEPGLNGEVLVNVKEAGAIGIFRNHVENGLDTCTMIAEEMDVTLGYVSRLATQAVKEGWLETKHRKYRLLDA